MKDQTKQDLQVELFKLAKAIEDDKINSLVVVAITNTGAPYRSISFQPESHVILMLMGLLSHLQTMFASALDDAIAKQESVIQKAVILPKSAGPSD